MMMQGPQQSTDQVVEMAYEQMRSAGLKGKEAEEALTMVATQIGLSGDDAKEFVAGYESYIQQKEGVSPSPSKITATTDDVPTGDSG